MNIKMIFYELEELAKTLEISIKKDKGGFKNGFAVINESKTILLNKNSPLESMSTALAKALSRFELEDYYIKPAVRLFIEEQGKLMREEEVVEFEITKQENE